MMTSSALPLAVICQSEIRDTGPPKPKDDKVTDPFTD
jgi:hypothetical protein